MVKRFGVEFSTKHEFGVEVVEHPHGPYALYSDYAALLAQRDMLVEALEELLAGVQRLPGLGAIAGVLEIQYKAGREALAKVRGEEK